MPPEVVMTLLELKEALGLAEIEYMVVGSLASSVHGLPRATRDADLLVVINYEQAHRLVLALKPKFYVSEEAAFEAIRYGASFSAIHEATFFQVDMFVVTSMPFNRAQFERREYIEVDPDLGLTMPFQSAEDTVLSKLEWYRSGGGVSERQWRDVMDILRAQGCQLDMNYLRRWAANLDIDDLLQRALQQVPDLGTGDTIDETPM